MNKKTQADPDMIAGYELTVEGEYVIKGQKETGFYRETFLLPKIVQYSDSMKWAFKPNPEDPKKKIKYSVPNVKRENAMRCGLFFIKNYMLHARLREKYRTKGYKNFRTHEIVTKKRVMVPAALAGDVSKLPISEMTESQLIQFAIFNSMLVDLNRYRDLGDKKIAVERAWRKKKIDVAKTSVPARENRLAEPDDIFDNSPVSELTDLDFDNSDVPDAGIADEVDVSNLSDQQIEDLDHPEVEVSELF